MTALQSGPDERYPDVASFAAALQPFADGRARELSWRLRIRRVSAGGFAALATLAGMVALLAWSLQQRGQERWAREDALPRLQALIAADDYAAAFDLAREIEGATPRDPLLRELEPSFSAKVTLNTAPDGARVSYRPYAGGEQDWRYIGETPLVDVAMPIGVGLWRIEKEGHDTALLALRKLAERFHVFAPTWPGFGAEPGEDLLEDMLVFTLHGLDVVDGLRVERPHLVGHSLGGMIAAEMACLANARFPRLTLLASVGLWLDAHPTPDLFATPPWELPALLFADPAAGQKLLLAGLDFGNDAALTRFMVDNARRLGSAGKILFPIPNRRLSKRLYRLRADTLLVFSREDRLVPPAYAEAWQRAIPRARLTWIEGAGHMLHLEQPERVASALAG